MFNHLKAHQIFIFSGLMACLLLASCKSHPDLVYFQNINDNDKSELKTVNTTPGLTVQPLDLLDIKVYSFDPVASAPFNPNINNVSTQREGQMYRVGPDGYIDFPVIGRIHLAQKTINEAQNILYTEVEKYLKDPVVNIRYTNLKVSVIGEVLRPGTFNLTSENNTILHALGMAGDMTIFAERTKIDIIREIDGVREIGTVNLHSPDFFKSPYYYLRQNDVVYVRPSKIKDTQVNSIASREVIPWVSLAVSFTTLIVAIMRLN